MNAKYIILFILLLLASLDGFSQNETVDTEDATTWKIAPSDFNPNLNSILTAVVEIDGELTRDTNDIVAAFVRDSIRGIAKLSPVLGQHMISMFIYSSTGEKEDVYFRVYDADKDVVLPVVDTLKNFGPLIIQGSFSKPDTIRAVNIKIDFEKENVFCTADNSGFVNTSIDGGKPPYLYQWSNGSTEPSIESVTAGRYYLTVTDGNTFSKIDSVEIENLQQAIPAPSLIASPNTLVCAGEDMTIFADAFDTDEDVSFEWFDITGNSIGTTPFFNIESIREPTQIFCEITVRDCKSQQSAIVIDTQAPDASFSVTPSQEITQTGLVQFKPTVVDTANLYEWEFGDSGWSTFPEAFYFYNLLGNFDVSLTVTDSSGCQTTEVIPNYISVIPNPRVIIRGEESSEEQPEEATAALPVRVFPNPFTDQVQLVVKVTDPGWYQLSLTDLLGRQIHFEETFLTAGIYQQRIALGHLSSNQNMYVLRFGNETVQQIVKIIHQN